MAGPLWIDSGQAAWNARVTVAAWSGVPMVERAKLPDSRFHDLRHAAATFLLAQGMTLEDVKNLLGHSSIVLTSNTYGHVLEHDAVLGG